MNDNDILEMVRRINQKKNPQAQLSPGSDYDPEDTSAPNDYIPRTSTDNDSQDDDAPVANKFTPSGKDVPVDSGSEDMASSLPSRSGDKDDDEDDTTPIAAKVPSRQPANEPEEDNDSNPKQNFSPLTNDNSEALKDAQAKADRNMLGVNLLNAGQTIGEAFSRNKFNRDVNKSLEANANSPVTDIAKQQASRKTDIDNLEAMYKQASNEKLRDPNSDISVATRNLLNDLGMNFGDGVSAYDVQQSTNIDKLLGVKARTDERLQEAQEKASSRADAANDKNKAEQDKRDQYIWARALQQARGDKDISTAVTSANRLQNTLNNLSQKSVVSPQDLNELQQLTVAVQGLNGRSGIAERQERYAHSLGLKATELQQFLSGQMTDVGKQNDILMKMKELARLEVGNFTNNLANRFKYKTAGLGSVLSRHPEYQQDLEDLKGAAGSQVVGSAEQDKDRNPASSDIHTTGLAPNEIRRVTSDGRSAIFNPLTKEFVRYE